MEKIKTERLFSLFFAIAAALLVLVYTVIVQANETQQMPKPWIWITDQTTLNIELGGIHLDSVYHSGHEHIVYSIYLNGEFWGYTQKRGNNITLKYDLSGINHSNGRYIPNGTYEIYVKSSLVGTNLSATYTDSEPSNTITFTVQGNPEETGTGQGNQNTQELPTPSISFNKANTAVNIDYSFPDVQGLRERTRFITVINGNRANPPVSFVHGHPIPLNELASTLGLSSGTYTLQFAADAEGWFMSPFSNALTWKIQEVQPTTQQLATPRITLNGSVLSWNPIPLTFATNENVGYSFRVNSTDYHWWYSELTSVDLANLPKNGGFDEFNFKQGETYTIQIWAHLGNIRSELSNTIRFTMPTQGNSIGTAETIKDERFTLTNVIGENTVIFDDIGDVRYIFVRDGARLEAVSTFLFPGTRYKFSNLLIGDSFLFNERFHSSEKRFSYDADYGDGTGERTDLTAGQSITLNANYIYYMLQGSIVILVVDEKTEAQLILTAQADSSGTGQGNQPQQGNQLQQINQLQQGNQPQTQNLIAPNISGASAWAHEGLNRAYNAGLIPSTLQSNYTQATTRAEFCALAVALYENIKGEITGRTTFTDTNDVNVQKMAFIGVVSGVGANRFDPNAQLTREQAASMLSRLSEAIGKPFPTQTPTFADNGNISSWAVNGVGSAQSAAIMSGVGNNLFAPKDPYTREQSIITILRVFDFAT